METTSRAPDAARDNLVNDPPSLHELDFILMESLSKSRLGKTTRKAMREARRTVRPFHVALRDRLIEATGDDQLYLACREVKEILTPPSAPEAA